MITRPPTRPQSLLRAFAKQTQSSQQPASLSFPRQTLFQRRCRHTLPVWANHARQEFFAKHGVPGLVSAETYQETYLKHTQYFCDRLNELVLGTADESETTFHLHQRYAHRPDKAYLYNIAAMVEFTRFFWEHLTESNDPAVLKPGLNTMRSIENVFGNVATLREEMLETADAMFGNGFVWLMKGENVGDLKILATYNAGSPYPGAAPRRDDTDMANVGNNPNGSLLSEQLSGRSGLGFDGEGRDIGISLGNVSAGHFGNFSANRSKHHAGLLNMQPILCVKVWEHQWLRDYGILGKKPYLTAWWDRIDWQKVESDHNLHETNGDAWQSGMSPYASTGGSSVLDALN